jgi:hypothetical protein
MALDIGKVVRGADEIGERALRCEIVAFFAADRRHVRIK